MTNTAAARPALTRRKIAIFLLDHIIEVCLIILIIGLTIGSKGFFTWANWTNIFRGNSLKGVIAFGMTMVIIAGLIDLSIGSTVGLTGVIVALIIREMLPLGVGADIACIVGMVVCILMAVGIGWMHGFFQHKTGMPAFIVTLASLYALQGLAGTLSGGSPFPTNSQSGTTS